ncbi:HNH endonuclease family protein [Streptomyces sp. NPDC001668]|uniref:HNH endonuclease family protein n=1 Tax=Streptomyces sp. NPDC001668 TaxID=3364598 RepID=UPI0036BBB8D8
MRSLATPAAVPHTTSVIINFSAHHAPARRLRGPLTVKPSTALRALCTAALAGTLAACHTPLTQHAAANDKPASSPARQALDRLPVHQAGTQSGYDRIDKFGTAWLDTTSAPGARNSCDTRNDVLFRDLSQVRFRDGSTCIVASGTLLKDPYTGRRIDFVRGRGSSGSLDIDHLVALGDSWRTGARALSQADREALANDPLNLAVVSASANRQKGDQDASTWLPAATGWRCTYVARQIAVKKKYHLWVTPSERTAMARVLGACPAQPLPGENDPGVALKKK